MNPNEDFELRRQLRALGGERAPARELWPQIAARLPARKRRARPLATWALAAGLVLALAFGLLPRPQPSLPDVPTPVAATDPVDTVLAAYGQVLALEQVQGPALLRQLHLPGGVERLAAARELDTSLRELAAALRIEPRSQLLRRLLHQTLQQRAALSRAALAA